MEDKEHWHESESAAIDCAEGIFQALLERKFLMRALRRFLGSHKVDLFFKKSIALEVYELLYANLTIGELRRKDPQASIAFVPSSLAVIGWARKVSVSFPGGHQVRVSRCTHFYLLLVQVVRWCLYALRMALFPILFLLRCGTHRGRICGRDPKQYKLALRVYANDFGFSNSGQEGRRNIDFVVDHHLLNRENVVFCLEDTTSERYYDDALRKRGYQVIELQNILSLFSVSFLVREIFQKTLRFWASVFPLAFFSQSILVKAVPTILWERLRWVRTLEMYHFEHFLVYNDYSPVHVIRNILLEQAGVKSGQYTHSTNIAISPRGYERQVLFSFSDYHTFYAWNDLIAKWSVDSRNAYRHVESVGCLWSSFVVECEKTPQPAELLGSIVDKFGKRPRILVGFFDTSVNPNELYTIDDAKLLIQHVMDLLGSDLDIGILFKPKYSDERLRQTAGDLYLDYHRLMDHPKCFFAGALSPSETVLAVADVMVCSCFTSPAVEALCAGRRAFYYDPADRLHGYLYERLDRFVVHGPDNLKPAIEYWYGMKEEVFQEFLHKQARGFLEPFTDGRALDRMRRSIVSDAMPDAN